MIASSKWERDFKSLPRYAMANQSQNLISLVAKNNVSAIL